jgi:putative transport protein
VKGVGFGARGVLIVAMVAGYIFTPQPIRILQDLGVVLFLLSAD